MMKRRKFLTVVLPLPSIRNLISYVPNIKSRTVNVSNFPKLPLETQANLLRRKWNLYFSSNFVLGHFSIYFPRALRGESYRDPNQE